MNYYERHIGDYLKDTVHLTLLEHGVYGRLLDVYYTREGAIPVAQVDRLIGARSKEERAALAAVLDEFFQVDADMVRHTRCDREIQRYQDKQRKATASANARWSKGKEHADSMRTHMRTHSEGSANGMLSSNQTPDTNNKRALVAGEDGGPGGPARADFEKPDPGSGPGSGTPPPTEAAAQAMAATGLQGVSAGNPTLRALLAQGITAAELQAAASAAVTQRKSFAWALARAQGQRHDAAAVGALPAAVSAAIDPDSQRAIEADAHRFGIGPWQRIDPKGNTVPWSAYAAKVKAKRAELAAQTGSETAAEPNPSEAAHP